MPGHADHPERKPTRLPAWDYASAGGYFITTCLQQREPRFGSVIHGAMRLNAAGEMVTATWIANAVRYPGVVLDAFVVMPDHLHAIVYIGAAPSVSEQRAGLSRLMQSFKSITTLEYGRGVRAGLHPPYDRVLWQRSFYDHIVRDDRDLERVRAYIEGNPGRWTEKYGDTPSQS